MRIINRRAWSGVGHIAALAVVGSVACSNNSSTPAEDAATFDAPGVLDANLDAGIAVPDSTATTATLTVLNFLNWCTVTINGGAGSSEATVTGTVTVGSTATIVITPSSSAFQIGADPWFGVTENNGGAAAGMDNGSGTTETSTATVVVSGNQCVSVCCQEPNMMPTPCPTSNPCP